MKVIYKNITDIKPYHKNPRKNDKAVDKVATSIDEFGFNQPIVVDEKNVIVVGHTRYKAAKLLGLKEVPVVYMPDGIDDDRVKAYRIADNKLNEYADWDNDLLISELIELDDNGFDLDIVGFDLDDLQTTQQLKDENWMSLADQFVVPPFTILDARGGDWMKRKQQWKGIGIESQNGREEGLTMPNEGYLAMKDASTSVFDPVLVEVINLWYSQMNDKILDPFAGGSVRGVVSSILGREYTGIDLRPEQIKANKENWQDLSTNGYMRLPSYEESTANNDPNWIVGDSNKRLDALEDNSYDLVMTCPPYADLEKYSDLEDDISNMEYDDFMRIYKSIIHKSADKLKDDKFMVIVVGDIRDKNGGYRDFVGDTVQAARDAGLTYYNEIIYITPTGTSGMMARRPFITSRKSRKHHQNVLVFNKVLNFVKGDPKMATINAGNVIVDPLIDYD
jgi:DNA modification methylase